MSVVGNNRVGIPIVLLHDAEGSVVTVETKKGELIRGLLFEAEDMMNLYVKNAVVTDPTGKVKRRVDQLYLRGPEIVFVALPASLRHAPMFQRIKHRRKHGGAPPEGVGVAVGQAAAILRKAKERRFAGQGRGGGRGPGGLGGGRGGGGGQDQGRGFGYGGGGPRGQTGGGQGRGYGGFSQGRGRPSGPYGGGGGHSHGGYGR